MSFSGEGVTLPEKPLCVIPQSSKRRGFRHHNNGMNKEELPTNPSKGLDASHWFSALVFHYRENDETTISKSRQLTKGIEKSVSKHLPEHQRKAPWFHCAISVAPRTHHDSACTATAFVNRQRNDSVDGVVGPSDAITIWNYFRQIKRLKTLLLHVHASLFRSTCANRRHCCLSDKKKKKRLSSDLDGAYP